MARRKNSVTTTNAIPAAVNVLDDLISAYHRGLTTPIYPRHSPDDLLIGSNDRRQAISRANNHRIATPDIPLSTSLWEQDLSYRLAEARETARVGSATVAEIDRAIEDTGFNDPFRTWLYVVWGRWEHRGRGYFGLRIVQPLQRVA